MKPTILYIYPSLATFIKKDLTFLGKYYAVKTSKQQWASKGRLFMNYFFQFFWLLKNIPSSKATLVMFGGHHSLIPALLCRILKKPCFIILGGTECVSLPKLNYGSLRKPLLKKVIEWTFRNASCLVPVHESLIEQKNNYIESKEYARQGVKIHFPGLRTSFKVIYNGFELQELNDREIKHNSFITVASVDNESRFYLKGIDKILEIAKAFPEATFTIIGMMKQLHENHQFPINVKLYPFLNYGEFKELLQTSVFYLQPSISEGFPNSLCEGMMNGCIPIGSEVGGIPDIISDTGYVLKSIKNEVILSTIKSAISLDSKQRKVLAKKARNRIIDHYSLARREKEFITLIEDYSK